MIKAIIFDFGGPIVDWEAGMHAVYQKHEDHRNLQRDTLRNLFEQYINGANIGDFHTVTDFIEKIKPSIDLTIEELNEVFDEANAAIYVLPEMVSYIEDLKKKYQYTLEKLGVRPEEAVFIDDLEENIQGARAVGIHGVLFKSFEQCRLDLENVLHTR